MIAGSDPESSEPAIIMFCNVHIGFIQQVYKVEFVEFPVIANQSAFLVWQSPEQKYHFSWMNSGKRQNRTVCMTISCLEFDGDFH